MAENGTVERASYVAMASAAMEALGNKKGCSRQAILKYMEQHNQLDGNNKTVNYHLREALKKGLDTGKFKQVSGNGANGSFALVKAKGGENPKKAGKEEQPAGGKAPRPKEPKAASAAPARPKPGDPPKPKDPPKLKAKAAVPPRPAKPNGTTATKTNASAKAKGASTGARGVPAIASRRKAMPTKVVEDEDEEEEEEEEEAEDYAEDDEEEEEEENEVDEDSDGAGDRTVTL